MGKYLSAFRGRRDYYQVPVTLAEAELLDQFKCPNRLMAQISVRRTKKYANMIGHSTSLLRKTIDVTR